MAHVTRTDEGPHERTAAMHAPAADVYDQNANQQEDASDASWYAGRNLSLTGDPTHKTYADPGRDEGKTPALPAHKTQMSAHATKLTTPQARLKLTPTRPVSGRESGAYRGRGRK